jgi:hypothetical protein
MHLRDDELWKRPVDGLMIQSQKKVLNDLRELRRDINDLKQRVAEIQIRIREHLEER